MLVSLALATNISFSAWLLEDDATIATALQLLDEAHDDLEEH